MKTKLFTLFLAIMATNSLWAYDFKYGDLYYEVLSSSTPYTVQVTYQEWSNNNYSGITTIAIPETVEYNDTTYSVVQIGSAFSFCSSLSSVTIPNSVTKIGQFAFSGCSSLNSINIPASVTEIGSLAFSYCTSLYSINIPESVEDIGKEAFYKSGIYNDESNWEDDALYVDNCLVDIDTDSDKTSFTIKENTRLISRLALNEWKSLKNITLPNSVKYISKHAFVSCTSLTSITLSNNLLSIGEDAFYRCSALKSITIPNSVTDIGKNAFYECTALMSITIPNSVTHIGEYAFYSCSALTSISLSHTLTDIANNTFRWCTSLSSITLPKNLLTIGSSAFYGCTSLSSITIPNCVNSIEDQAFSKCSSLISISIPETVTYIGANAFAETPWYDNQPDGVLYINNVLYQYKGSMLPNTSINIKDGTISISPKAFEYFSSLISVTIPGSVTIIGHKAFMCCPNLKSVTCKANKIPQIYWSTFTEVPLSESTLYVPMESLNDYKTTEYWNEFGTILPIEGTAVNNVESSNSSSTRKMLQNGQVVILHNDNSYNVMGQEIE